MGEKEGMGGHEELKDIPGQADPRKQRRDSVGTANIPLLLFPQQEPDCLCDKLQKPS